MKNPAELRDMITDNEIEIERLYIEYEEVKAENFGLHYVHERINGFISKLKATNKEYSEKIFKLEDKSDGKWNQQQKNLYDYSRNGANSYFKESNCGY